MRDIKFKAKRVDNGEWVFGCYGVKGLGTDLETHCIMISTLNDGKLDYFYFTDVEVIPNTVCQYNSVLEAYKDDKLIVSSSEYLDNGNSVWEEGLEDEACVLKYNDFDGWFFKTLQNEDIPICMVDDLYFEVIGNTHD